MKREEMKLWLNDQLELQNKLTTGAAIGMAAIGSIAVLMEMGLFYFIVRIGFIKNGPLAFLATVGILAGLQFLIWVRLKKDLPDREVDVELETGDFSIQIAPAMSLVWTYGLGSMETDQSWVERLLGLLTLPQRMSMAAFYTWKRRDELKRVNVDPCAAVLRLLHKEGAGLEMKELVEKAKLSDPATTLRHVTLIDGIVLLSRKSRGLSMANRLVDDINDWKGKRTTSPGGSAD